MEAKEREFKKVDYQECSQKYDESVKETLRNSPEDVDLEKMRAYLYGYTFTEKYAQCEIPDELCMDYWEEQYVASLCDDDIEDDPEVDDVDFVIDDEEWEESNYEGLDKYDVSTPQERLILEAIDSTGDGNTPETALSVIDVGQEYEYLARVFPYDVLRVSRQSVKDGIDCLTFEENPFEIECIYFDITRRFEVGYGRVENPT